MRGSEIDIVHESSTGSYRTRGQNQIVSYNGARSDCIAQENITRLYHTTEQGQIVSYMGFNGGKGKRERKSKAVQHICVM